MKEKSQIIYNIEPNRFKNVILFKALQKIKNDQLHKNVKVNWLIPKYLHKFILFYEKNLQYLVAAGIFK